MQPHNSINVPAKTLFRHQVLSLVASRYLTIKQASKELKLSISQTKRLWRIYRDSQGNVLKLLPVTRKKSATVLTKTVKGEITNLYQSSPNLTCYHLTDQLNKQGITISRETVRKVLKETKQDNSVKSTKTKPSGKFEAQRFGQIIQMDTCYGSWLQGSKYQYLIACLDDYSRFIVSFGLFPTDSTWTNMQVIKKLIEKWGLPEILYTDNASHFNVIRHIDKLKPWNYPKHYQTKIQEVLAKLGVTHIAHHPFNPRAKGKIERFFRFIQDRLLRDNAARNIAELEYQIHNWIKWYNHEHINRTTKLKPANRLSPSAFKPLPPETNLDELFVVKETRKVNKDNTISFKGKLYQIPREHHVAGLKVDLHLMDKMISVYYQGKILTKLVIN